VSEGAVRSDPAQSAGKNGKCGTAFYRDLDGDGFGDRAALVRSCAQPAGYVPRDGDCFDGNERAHPGATGQFMIDRGDGSFDYDCDGVETRARPSFAVCPSTRGACEPGASGCDDRAISGTWAAAENGGWTQLEPRCTGAACATEAHDVPRCGQAGSWGLSVRWDVLAAAYTCARPLAGTTRIQTCR
jgi:hypothetical protein